MPKSPSTSVLPPTNEYEMVKTAEIVFRDNSSHTIDFLGTIHQFMLGEMIYFKEPNGDLFYVNMKEIRSMRTWRKDVLRKDEQE